MKTSKRLGARLLPAMCLLWLVVLTGCASGGVVVLPSGDIRQVEGGWLVPDAALAELLECCEFCTDK